MSLLSAVRRGCLAALAAAVPAQAGSEIRVPKDQPTIQAAVDAARPGQRIVVSHGKFCGATITQRVELVGKHGATIIGCPEPVAGVLRVGFLLPMTGPRGQHPRLHLRWEGISNADLTPLAARRSSAERSTR
jgi:hypothetical protein